MVGNEAIYSALKVGSDFEISFLTMGRKIQSNANKGNINTRVQICRILMSIFIKSPCAHNHNVTIGERCTCVMPITLQ